MLGSRQAVLAAALLVLVLIPAPALAEDITTDELAQLATDAGTNSDSRRQLADVTTLDGEPVAVDSVLGGAPGDEATRLDTLVDLLAEPEPSPRDGPALRTEASDITSKPPFAAEVASTPGILDRIWEFLSRLLGTEGAQGIALLAIVIVALLIAVPVLSQLVGRRSRERDEAVPEIRRHDLLGEAQNAAGAGDHDDAVRLLFLDGAEYLESHQVVPNAATTSTSTVRPIATDTHFLDRFDEIAYGGDTADQQDVTEAVSAWQQLKRRFK